MPETLRSPAGSPPPRRPSVKPPDPTYLSRFGSASNPAANTAIANVRWAEEFPCFGFGSLNSVCVCAWLLLLALPLLFFALVAPSLLYEHNPGLLVIAAVLFGLTCVCFLFVSCTNPGVAPRPEPLNAQSDRVSPRTASAIAKTSLVYPHPGDEYTYCADSNRYVRGFDHFCDFVGNDIGAHNMPYFVMFLVSLASFSAFLFTCCVVSGDCTRCNSCNG